MLKADDFVMVGIVAAGVLVAGLIMSNFRDIKLIDDAHNGFDS